VFGKLADCSRQLQNPDKKIKLQAGDNSSGGREALDQGAENF
jgi:hypothetical protein